MRTTLVFLPLFFAPSIAPGQEILRGASDGIPVLFNGDAVVLEAGEPRKELECTISASRVFLGFDMRFHTGYIVSIPLRELEGSGNLLSILFRVTEKTQREPVYFTQQLKVPPITETKGFVNLEGGFDVGEGSYHVDWLMRDYQGRYCASNWDVEAELSSKDRQVAVALPPATIKRMENEQFQPEPPVQRAQEQAPLNVKVLMNFAPPRQNAAAIDAADTTALVSILRNISRNPRIGKLTLVAFNMQEQKVFYRQDAADHIDFPAMGRALKKVALGTVRVSQLENRHGETEFLSDLLKNETAVEGSTDGLIFVGPKAYVDQTVPEDELKKVGDLDYPVFYMNYSPDPQTTPWRDSIGRIVKFFKGREFTITGPRDLWNAITETVTRITKSKQTHALMPTGQFE